jgi:hypothetical protein
MEWRLQLHSRQFKGLFVHTKANKQHLIEQLVITQNYRTTLQYCTSICTVVDVHSDTYDNGSRSVDHVCCSENRFIVVRDDSIPRR